MIEIASASHLGLPGNSPAMSTTTGRPAGVGRDGARVAVNIATGNLIMQREDETLVARGADMSVLRTYNSQGTFDGDNNDNWRIGFNRLVRNLAGTLDTEGSTVVRVDGDGAEHTYDWDAALGAYIDKAGEGSHDRLVHDGVNWT